jgi:hypothetical protein
MLRIAESARVWPGDLLALANGHICQFWRWRYYVVERTWHRPGAGGVPTIALLPEPKGGARRCGGQAPAA